ncbi:pyridoxamine 5'-phosphate oxidase family protein [Seleniivibrio woodruffii]|uniref:Pyridoxamine 5'-phosphate oxidase n=1 Tax=Seleniivibrio woodruffii TaxID=1078050 RepID=A0A4R1KBP8_9BACT|nr:pyridoxamine 5'-phosphate oxidase family protein [Seleniivibrio woodruffii]TCK61915.1 pyridoxamine 5'-phosphate oxidase [Seleniivibrio woodruffii]TVZ34968.1 pyridoxamine 5'-phosphate oxidase [Seleniivibrio woodruffii]
MFSETFLEVVKNEGVVSIVTWGSGEPHIVNTWNSYLTITDDSRILIPAAGMTSTEADLAVNSRVKVTLGSKNVQGLFAMGTGFRLEGTARLFAEGAEYEMMKEKYPFLTRVLEIKPELVKQTV